MLWLPRKLQSCFCFLAVETLREENDLEESPCVEKLEAPFVGEVGID